MHRFQFRPVTNLMFLLLLAVPMPVPVLADGLPPSGVQVEFSVTELAAEYSGESGFLIEQGKAEPLSLATADFDEDGMPDLVVGYGDADAGLVVVHRGNVEAVYPKAGQDAGEAFLPVAEVFATSQRADLIGSGDFDADGNYDIVVGSLGETTLRLMRGNGTGSFADAEMISLGGELTAMAVGEVNRRDGLADLVVGVNGRGGPHLLVFEWPGGAWRGEPERIDVHDTVESIALARTDEDGLVDLVVSSSDVKVLVRGRDRRLNSTAGVRSTVAAPIVEPWLSEFVKLESINSFAEYSLGQGSIRAAVDMRLNRDALPDLVAIVEGEPVPQVYKSFSRTTYAVDSTADDADFSAADGVCDTDDSTGDGPCTLRAAIEQANVSSGADAIEFAIPGAGPHTIQPASQLPEITEALTIDGFTQSGASANTVAFPGAMDSVLMIEIDGANAGLRTSGLYITSGDCTVRGLVINRWTSDSYHYGGHGVELYLGANNIVEGNYIGCDVTCTSQLPNHRRGVSVGASDNCTIGGTAPAARNVISGNSTGVRITAVDTLVQGNFFGTDPGGTLYVNFSGWTGLEIDAGSSTTVGGGASGAGNLVTANSGVGVRLWNWTTGNLIQGNIIGPNHTGIVMLQNGTGIELDRASSTLIGGTAPGLGNVISGNLEDGVRLMDVSGAEVLGNLIGVGIDSATPLGNSGSGVKAANDISGLQIGGALPGSGNLIAYNGGIYGNGVDVLWQTATGVSILGNRIFSNEIYRLGIDLGNDWVTPNDPGDGDTGANNLQNYPVLTSVSGGGATVNGTLNSAPSTEFHIEFFSNSSCNPSGYGEGETFLGADTVTTDAAGDVSFSSSLTTFAPGGGFITATATDPSGNTSEFSACFENIASADLALSMDDGVTTVIPGAQTTYTIIASNSSGPSGALGRHRDRHLSPQL